MLTEETVLQSLLDLKAKTERGDLRRDKVLSPWLGSFLDQETPSGILPAELKLVEACRKGTQCDLVNERPQLGQGQTPADYPNLRIRADFLRFLALGGDETVSIHETGILLVGAIIDSSLDLRGAKCVSNLTLRRCHIAGELLIVGASLGSLTLDGSRVAKIAGARANIAGSIFLRGGFVCDGEVSLHAATIGANLDCTGGYFKGEHAKNSLQCQGAKIGGDVYLRNGFVSQGRVWFHAASIDCDLDCTGGHFKNENGDSLQCQGTKIAGMCCCEETLFLKDKFRL
jgi:hypothetical protein